MATQRYDYDNYYPIGTIEQADGGYWIVINSGIDADGNGWSLWEYRSTGGGGGDSGDTGGGGSGNTKNPGTYSISNITANGAWLRVVSGDYTCYTAFIRRTDSTTLKELRLTATGPNQWLDFDLGSDLEPNTSYTVNVRASSDWIPSDPNFLGAKTFTTKELATTGLYIYASKNGVTDWYPATPYIYSNGWKEATPYIYSNGWK